MTRFHEVSPQRERLDHFCADARRRYTTSIRTAGEGKPFSRPAWRAEDGADYAAEAAARACEICVAPPAACPAALVPDAHEVAAKARREMVRRAGRV